MFFQIAQRHCDELQNVDPRHLTEVVTEQCFEYLQKGPNADVSYCKTALRSPARRPRGVGEADSRCEQAKVGSAQPGPTDCKEAAGARQTGKREDGVAVAHQGQEPAEGAHGMLHLWLTCAQQTQEILMADKIHVFEAIEEFKQYQDRGALNRMEFKMVMNDLIDREG